MKQAPAERGDLIARFERIAAEYGGNTAVVEASASPDRPAAAYAYEALNQRRIEIAGALVQEHGLGPGDSVGLVQARRYETIAAMLAIATVGARYVPLDADLPEDRLRFLMTDSKVRLLLSAAAEAPAQAIPISSLRRETRAAGGVSGASPLYVMYTSGSTGTPKGVVVPQKAVYRLVVATDFMTLDDQTRFLHFAPQSFDAATLEIWGPLLNGGTCVLCPDEVLDPGKLDALVREHRITAMWLTAALFNQLVVLRPAAFGTLDTLLFGGERASVSHVRQAAALWPDTALINGYGPTENTTFTCCHRVRDRDIDDQSREIPIGRPIAGTRVRVADEHLAEVPVGTAGELLAGGEGLAVGYLNQAGLTAERFVVDGEGERWYRTGDLVIEDRDGVIHFQGRADRQLKIHGHRIEPGEVEAVLLADDRLSHAHVLAVKTPEGDTKLVAYLVGAYERSALQKRLADTLPRFMVPSVFVGIDELPTTKNGKVDVEKLPNPFLERDAAPAAMAGNGMAGLVAATWKQVVSGIALNGNDDNFFDVGGTSMDMMRVRKALEDQLATNISLVTLFQYPTVSKLASHLETLGETDTGADSAADRAARRRKKLAQRQAKRARMRN